MKVRFLLDEDQSPRLKISLLRLNPSVDVLRVGESGAPVLGTPDPELLQYLEASERLLVTANRVSFPSHVDAHYTQGGRIWGILWVRPRIPVGRLAQDLHLIWEASEAEEWLDRTEWLPF